MALDGGLDEVAGVFGAMVYSVEMKLISFVDRRVERSERNNLVPSGDPVSNQYVRVDLLRCMPNDPYRMQYS